MAAMSTHTHEADAPRTERAKALRTLGVLVGVAALVVALLGVLVWKFPSPAASTVASAPASTTAKPAAPDDARVPGIQADAERLRTAALGTPVAVEHLDRPGLKELLDRLIAEEAKPAQTKATDDALHLLGLLTADQDLESITRAGLDAQVAGLYDPKTDKLYVVDGTAVQATQSTLLHEIVHAIQDKRYDLEGTIFKSRPTDADGQSAAQAVAEGDATEVQMRYIQEGGLGVALDELGGTIGLISEAPKSGLTMPDYLQRAATFPYITGSEFIAAVRAKGGEEAVDRAFRTPPKSTLAIMKPGIWLSGNDTPTAVTLPRPAAGAKRTLSTTFGASDLWAMLNDRTLAESWRGGRIAVDRTGARAAMTLVIASVRPVDLAAALRTKLPASARVTVAGAIVTATNAATLT